MNLLLHRLSLVRKVRNVADRQKQSNDRSVECRAVIKRYSGYGEGREKAQKATMGI